MKKFGLFAQIGDKFGTVGATMGCAMCFPALASIGAVGLGFLAQWEGLFITTLLPSLPTPNWKEQKSQVEVCKGNIKHYRIGGD